MDGPEQEPRQATRQYRDPLDEIWLGVARRLGLRVVRNPDAYASTDGRGTLVIGSEETLDADDGLAQMILHEICHWLVEGDEAAELPDWGLENETDSDAPREQACLRLQAELLRRHGLRRVLAPTTDYRVFYDRLPADPLEPSEDETSVAARLGLRRSARDPWFPVLEEALTATAVIARQALSFAGRERRPEETTTSLWCDVEATPVPHPTGLPPSPVAGRRCGDCAWAYDAGGQRRCRRADDQRIENAWAACACFDSGLDCLRCGACCREGFETVTVQPDDPVVAKRPELIVECSSWIEIAREGERCAALEGGLGPGFSCRIYEDRPLPCRELEINGANCLLARRRAGLTS